MAEREKPSVHLLNPYHKFKLLTFNKRQSTAKVVTIPGVPTVYAAVSKLGVVGIFNTELHLQKTYKAAVQDHLETKDVKRSTNFAWVTDVVFMCDCMKLVISTTNRTLHFYDISASHHMEEFRLCGLPDAPTCMAYSPSSSDQEDSLLIVGDERGGWIAFAFSEPETSLFKRTEMGTAEKILFQNIETHFRYVTVRHVPRIHTQPVNQLHFDASHQYVNTCSDDHECSVLIRDLTGLRNQYAFRQPKGARCFDFLPDKMIMVTGSRDGAVRVWTVYAPTRPTAILNGHATTVIDIHIFSSFDQILSLSQDAVLILWSLDSGDCLQTLHLNFPQLSYNVYNMDFGMFPVHVDTPDNRSILITCGEWIAEIHFDNGNDVSDDNRLDTSIPPDYLCSTLLPPPDDKVSQEDQNVAMTVEEELRSLLTPIDWVLSSSVALVKPSLATRQREKHEAQLRADVARKKLTHHFFRRSKCRSPGMAFNQTQMRQLVDDGGTHWALIMHPFQPLESIAVLPPRPEGKLIAISNSKQS